MVRVSWNDAVLYGPKNKATELTRMETVGVLEKNTEDFIVIRSPKTTRKKDDSSHPNKLPDFYFIPSGMIQNVEVVL